MYIVYLFRAYCFTVASVDGEHTHWISFSILNLCKLGFIVVAVFAASFGPFIDHIPQVGTQLPVPGTPYTYQLQKKEIIIIS